MEHKSLLHNAPSLNLSSIILFWQKSRKIDHVSWIDTELIWNFIFPWKWPACAAAWIGNTWRNTDATKVAHICVQFVLLTYLFFSVINSWNTQTFSVKKRGFGINELWSLTGFIFNENKSDYSENLWLKKRVCEQNKIKKICAQEQLTRRIMIWEFLTKSGEKSSE